MQYGTNLHEVSITALPSFDEEDSAYINRESCSIPLWHRLPNFRGVARLSSDFSLFCRSACKFTLLRRWQARPSQSAVPASKNQDFPAEKSQTSPETACKRLADGNDRTRQASRYWPRIIDEFRKNYCPKSAPPLVLPSAPTDVEKYSFVKMNKAFLIVCDIIALTSLGYGAWGFTISSPIYAWFALYVTINEIYILTALFVTAIGKELNLDAHTQVLQNNAITDQGPTVDVYLPICSEPLEVIENTWRYVSVLQYPTSKLCIYVLDDSADGNGSSDFIRALAKLFGFKYIRRHNRPHLKKSGNLRYAFSQTKGEFFVIFDADFCPRADFLLDTIPYLLADEKRAIIQTPQYFRSLPDQTWVEQGAGASQELIYRLTMTSRDRWGAAICVGSNAVYRRAAFEPIGGVYAIDCSEDIYTGWYAITHGWTVKYLPLVLACGMCPDTPRAFFSQQMRWCHGTMSLVSQREFWTGKVDKKVKLCFIISAMNYITNAVEPFLYPPLASLNLLTHPGTFRYYRLLAIYPSIIMGFVARKLWARGRYTFSVLYTDQVLAFASLQSIWDLIVGKPLSWKPTGGNGGSQKNRRYSNMRILAWAWTMLHTSAFIVLAVYRLVGGLEWYNLLPVFGLNLVSLLWLHRFLLYQHLKESKT